MSWLEFPLRILASIMLSSRAKGIIESQSKPQHQYNNVTSVHYTPACSYEVSIITRP